MKSLNKILLYTFIIFVCFGSVVYSASRPYFSLDVAKNAASHNNKGLERLQDGYYDMAIGEFQLAIELSPPTSKANAIYYNNLGETYMKIQAYAEAQNAFENAIKISPLTFLYYKNVVQAYKMQGILNSKIQQYKKLENQNTLYKVIIGLCYIEKGDIRHGIITLDEFCMLEPYLIITGGVKTYLKELIEKYEN